MRKVILSALCLAVLYSFSSAKEIPPSPRTYVYNEGVIKDPGALSKQLAGFEKRTGHQMVVALFQSLDGESIEGYANRIFKAWKIGDRKRNDGLLFAAFLKDRKWRVEVGYGFEGVLTDIQAHDIATAAAVPLFKRGDFDGGVRAVVFSLQNVVGTSRGGFPAGEVHGDVSDASASAATHESAPSGSQDVPWLFLGVGFGFFGFALVMWFYLRSKMNRRNRHFASMRDAASIVPPSYSASSYETPSYSPPASSYTAPDYSPSPSSESSESLSSDSSWSSFGGGSDSSGFSGGGGDSGGAGSSGGW